MLACAIFFPLTSWISGAIRSFASLLLDLKSIPYNTYQSSTGLVSLVLLAVRYVTARLTGDSQGREKYTSQTRPRTSRCPAEVMFSCLRNIIAAEISEKVLKTLNKFVTLYGFRWPLSFPITLLDVKTVVTNGRKTLTILHLIKEFDKRDKSWWWNNAKRCWGHFNIYIYDSIIP